jgi:hypothetical protein
MSCGKYSPTVSASYAKDQDWFERHCLPGEWYDIEGYDCYGYNTNGIDRAGYREDDYLLSEWVDDVYCYSLYEKINYKYHNIFLGDLRKTQ